PRTVWFPGRVRPEPGVLRRTTATSSRLNCRPTTPPCRVHALEVSWRARLTGAIALHQPEFGLRHSVYSLPYGVRANVTTTARLSQHPSEWGEPAQRAANRCC